MDENTARNLLNEYKTPQHIIKHGEIVGKVGEMIAEAYLKKGTYVDVESVFLAGLLHDILRLVDISENKYNEFIKTQDPEKIKIWDELRMKYSNIGHPEATYKLLSEKGFEEIGLMIKKHGFESILEDPPFTLEEKILTYADKRVLHEKVVSMEDRFYDGHVRYFSKKMPAEYENKIQKVYYALEKELFEPIDFNPEEINNQTILQ